MHTQPLAKTPRWPRRSLWLTIVASLALIVAACGGTNNAGSAGEDSKGGVDYLVGAPLVSSGPAAFAGVPVVQGIDLAAKEINDSDFFGDGSTLTIDHADTGGDPAKAIAAFKQAQADGAVAVLCCTLAGEAGALKPLILEGDLPAVVTVSILEGLAQAPHLFRPFPVPSSPQGMYDQFLDAVFGDGEYTSAVMVVNNDNDSMVQDGALYASGLERNDVELKKTIQVVTAETSFVSVATEIVDLNPDVVVASTIGSSTAGLAKALRERGFDRPIISNVGADSPPAYEASGGAMAGTIFPTTFNSHFPSNDQAAEFVTAYRAAYDAEPDFFAAQGYVATKLVAAAIKQAGVADPAAVGEALAAVTTFESVYGDLSFTNGQAEIEQPALYLEWGPDGELTQINQP